MFARFFNRSIHEEDLTVHLFTIHRLPINQSFYRIYVGGVCIIASSTSIDVSTKNKLEHILYTLLPRVLSAVINDGDDDDDDDKEADILCVRLSSLLLI